MRGRACFQPDESLAPRLRTPDPLCRQAAGQASRAAAGDLSCGGRVFIAGLLSPTTGLRAGPAPLTLTRYATPRRPGYSLDGEKQAVRSVGMANSGCHCVSRRPGRRMGRSADRAGSRDRLRRTELYRLYAIPA